MLSLLIVIFLSLSFPLCQIRLMFTIYELMHNMTSFASEKILIQISWLHIQCAAS